MWLALLLVACGPDTDGDGTRDGRDCAPDVPRVHPGALEICNGVDDDCDGYVDEGVSLVAFWDRDGDGFGDPDLARRVCVLPEDGSTEAGDCDDLDAAVFPGATERCDGLDDDCDGEVDEGAVREFWPDEDGDGYGVPGATVTGCAPPEGYAASDDDCDDADAAAWAPSAGEACDERDNDCDGAVDEDLPPTRVWADADADGHGDPAKPVLACGPVAGTSADADDCDDADPAVGPHADELAGNGKDEDCDGYVDEIAVPAHHPTVDAALAAASPGDVVQLSDGTWTVNLDLTGAGVTLAGNGCGRTLLYGDGAGRLVRLDGGAIERMTLAGGTSERGGAVLVEGDATLSRVCVESSVSTGEGGGIAVAAGHLRLEDAIVARNQSTGHGGGLWVGPGASATVLRSTFSLNQGADGAALAAEGGLATVRSSVFSANQARSDGGALASLASGPTIGTVDATNVTFVANRAASRGQATYDGASILRVNNALAVGHERDRPLFYAYAPKEHALGHIGLWRNAGRERPEGILVDAPRGDPTWLAWDPTSDPLGWDLRLSHGSPFIDAGDPSILDADGTPADLGASGGPDAPEGFDWGYASDQDEDGLPDGWEQRGGLLTWADDAAADPDGDGLDNAAELAAGSDPSVADTDEDGVEDGADDRPTDPRDHRPLAVLAREAFALVGEPVLLDASGSYDPTGEALTYAWALEPPPGAAPAAVADPGAPSTAAVPGEPGDWTVTVEVSDGRATSSATMLLHVVEALIVPDDADTIGQAIDAATSGDVIAIRPGIYAEALDPLGKSLTLLGLGEPDEVVIDPGGADRALTAIDEEQLTIARLTLQNGRADQGGAALAAPKSSLTFVQARLVDNRADADGGAIWANGAAVTLIDTELARNVAVEDGGAVAISDADLRAVRATFTDNRAGTVGGAVFAVSGTDRWHLLENVLLQGNRAPKGSAVALSGSKSDLTLLHAAVVDNGGAGGVLWAGSGRLTAIDSLISWNTGDAVLSRDTGAVLPLHAAYFDNDASLASHVDDALGDEPGTVAVDPRVVGFSDDSAANDLLMPRPGSPLVDAGNPENTDLDGTRADIGLYGGPNASHDALPFLRDTDGDGMTDGWELAHGLDPRVDDAAGDADADGLSNAEEFGRDTDPARADSDSDGLSDPDEIAAGTDPSDPSDHRPVAVAGADQRVGAGAVVTLDGAASSDPNGDPLTFAWRFALKPPTSKLADAALAKSASPSFAPDVRGVYEVELTVSDARATSAPDRVRVDVYGALRVPDDYPTIAAALAEIIDDDTIVLGAGTFEALLDAAGTRLSVEGAGADRTRVRAVTGEPVAKVRGGETLTLRGLSLTGGVGSNGGGVDCSRSTLRLEGVRVTGNAGYAGGGLGLDDCDTTLVDTDVLGNFSSYTGGGLYGSQGTLSWTRGTLAENRSEASGGGAYASRVDVTLRNLVIRDNATGANGGGWYQIFGPIDARHLTVARNSGGLGAIFATESPGRVDHAIFQENVGYGLYRSGSQALAADFSAWFGQTVNASVPTSLSSTGTHRHVDARFADGWRLSALSPLIDAGDPSCRDPDGSVCDLGAFGGPDAPAGFDDAYRDDDADGLADAWEAEHGASEPSADPDGDGLDNGDEHDAGTDPNDADTDADGLPDGSDPSPLDGAARPVADAGPDLSGLPGTALPLDGTRSKAPSGKPLTYAWSLVARPGRSTAAAPAPTAKPSFTPDVPGTYVLALVVSDGALGSAPDELAITVAGAVKVPEDYASVGLAVAAVADGGSVEIAAGTWPTRVELAGKDVSFVGAGRDLTVLDGEGVDTVVRALRSESVALAHLTVARGFGGRGGGLRIVGGTLDLLDVALVESEAITGGALHCEKCDVTADGLRVADNVARRTGGGLQLEEGSLTADHALLAGNVAFEQFGGAIYARGAPITLNHAIFADNVAAKGGGLYLTSSFGTAAEAKLDRVTATFNAGAQGAFLYTSLTPVTLTNAVVAFSKGYAVSHSGDDTLWTQSYSCFWDNAPRHYEDEGINPVGTRGNISSNPRFNVATANGDWSDEDWHLSPASPAKNTGTGAADADGSSPDMGAFGGPGGAWTP